MSEANIPNRVAMTGPWKRHIEYNEDTHEINECKLSDITWCTKWIATLDDYTTVHRITAETIQNAYAAGYTKQDILHVTGFDVPDLHRLELRNSPHTPELQLPYHDIGNFSFHGEKARVAHLYAMMYTVCTDESKLDNMFELDTLRDDSFYVKRSAIIKSKKNLKARVKVDVPPGEVHEILAKAMGVSRHGNKLMFHNGDQRLRYICVFKVGTDNVDLNDVWPVKNSIVSIIEKDQVYGAGEIGRVTAALTRVTLGAWDDNDDEEMDEENEQKNQDRLIRHEKSVHGLFAVKRALHSACAHRFIAVHESVNVSGKTPLGLKDSFWSHLRNHNKEGLQDTPLIEFVTRRQINQFEDSDDPPPYGHILNTLSDGFRPAQSDALELMFRENVLRPGLYILPCGGGKTLLGIAAAVRSGSQHVLILVPNSTIGDQWKKRLYDRARVRAKTMKDVNKLKKRDVNENPMVAVVSWNVLAWGGCKNKETSAQESKQEDMRLSRINGRKIAGVENILFCFWDMVIIDEVHNIRTPQNQCLLSKLSYKTMIGLTATASNEEKREKGKKKIRHPPWHVDVAPVMFETAWPLDYARTSNIHCEPYGEYDSQFRAVTLAHNTASIQGNPTEYASTIYNAMKMKLPTYMSDYKQMLEYNPIKMEKVAELIEYHEANNDPIIVFANYLEHIQILQRRFVKLPLLGKHQHFGEYLRTSVEKYILNVRADYISPFGSSFGYDKDGDGDDENVWETTFMNQWNPEDWYSKQSELMELCPNVPFDANFCHHYVSCMRERVDDELQKISDILGPDKPLKTVQKVTDSMWARLFYLFDTPRWVMFGDTGAEYPYNVSTEHRYRIYEKFNKKHIKTLFLSRIGNEGVDLPGTRVIIVVNGQGGSETEDAQRFGRALRGDEGTRYFYSVFTDTQHDAVLNSERDDAMQREKFLKARGYSFEDKYFDPPDYDWIPRDADNIPIAYPWFFITREFLQQRPTRIWLRAGDVMERLTLNHRDGQCTYFRTQIESDNNLQMATYIAKEFRYELNEIS